MEVEPPTISLRSAIFSLVALAILTVGMMVVIEAIGGIDRLQMIVVEAGSWAPVVYIVLKASTFVLAPLSGTPLKVAAGALFGIWDGTVYTLLGDVIGGSTNFWIARLLGRRVVTRFVGRSGITRVDDFGRQLGGWRALLFARLFLSALYDFVSYAAGLITLPFRQYLVVTTIGGIFPVVFWVTLGASFGEDSRVLLWVYGGLGVLFLIAIVLQRRIWRVLRGSAKLGTGVDSNGTRPK
jgi:uncharacterized membrane protein YdjX (TVP38/TMEM64 family)